LHDKSKHHHGNSTPDPNTFEMLDLLRRQLPGSPFTSDDHLAAEHPTEQSAVGGVLKMGETSIVGRRFATMTSPAKISIQSKRE